MLRPLLSRARPFLSRQSTPLTLLQAMSTNPPPAKKARFSGGKKKQPKMNKKQAKAAAAGIVTGSGDEVLQYSVLELLGQEKVDKITEEGKDSLSPFEHLQEVEVDILALSSHGAFTFSTSLLIEDNAEPVFVYRRRLGHGSWSRLARSSSVLRAWRKSAGQGLSL